MAKASAHAWEVSDDYDGPSGRSFMVRLRIGEGDEFFCEFTEDHNNLVSNPESSFICVDSVAMVALKRDDLMVPLQSLGLRTDPRVNDGYFRVLDAINVCAMLGDWHYLEVNEPTKPDGVMGSILTRIGRPGIIGTNYVPKDMKAFVEVARKHKISTNTEEPILLMVGVKDVDYKCAEIITINPRATGGGRIFILRPLEYPWELVA